MSQGQKKELGLMDIDELFPVEVDQNLELAVKVLLEFLADIRKEQDSFGLNSAQGKNLMPQIRRIQKQLADLHDLIESTKYPPKSALKKDDVRLFLHSFLQIYSKKMSKGDGAKMRQKLQELWLKIRNER